MREWLVWLYVYAPRYMHDGVTIFGGTGDPLRVDKVKVEGNGAMEACWAAYDLYKGQAVYVEIDKMQRTARKVR